MLIGPTVLPGKRFVLIGNLTTLVTPTQLTTLPRPGLAWPGLARGLSQPSTLKGT